MGDRYILHVKCKCGHDQEGVYYAPTCGFTHWDCPKCHQRIDLAEYSGISCEDCSNKELIESICKP